MSQVSVNPYRFHMLQIQNKTHERIKAVKPEITEQETTTTFPDIPSELRPTDLQRGIPKLAKDGVAVAQISSLLLQIPTWHEIRLGDSRRLDISQPVHLVVTSPPYWTLKKYPGAKGQLGQVEDYDEFLHGLKAVWEKCFHALVPGSRLVCVVGDVCLSRRCNGGRHTVIPLHASIQEQCRKIGFDNLAPIIWYKIANIQTESHRSGHYLGKPFEPNGVIKNDIEYILMFRKPGGYRRPSETARILSLISAEEHDLWFRQIWMGLNGASTRKHPAPYPVELAQRLIRMFSFAGDTIMDPFAGTGTTSVAAQRCGRHSVGIEIEPVYVETASKRLKLC